jgi:DUF4097 and DUF4098 domain-containing protein YvlB
MKFILCLTLSFLFFNLVAAQEIKRQRGGFAAVITDRFDISPGGMLDMGDLVGDVNVWGREGNQVEIVQEFFFDVDSRKEAEDALERFRARVTRSGDRLKVTGNTRDLGRHVTATYRATVPRRFNVSVETMGGDILLEELEGEVSLETLGGDVDVSALTGTLTAESAGGDIEVSDFSGDADLETAGGDLELKGVQEGPFRLKTAGGDITIRSAVGAVRAKTSGGDVEVRQVQGDQNLSTSGGDVFLQDVKGTFHQAETSGGDVRADHVTGNLTGHTSGGDIEITDISGDVEISTSGGDLDVKAVKGKLRGKTSGGEITVRVVGEGMLKEPLSLSTSGGDIQLTLPSSVRATVEVEIRTQDPRADYNIRSDFPLEIDDGTDRPKYGYRWITAFGDINGGGPLIELRTNEGNIYIKK